MKKFVVNHIYKMWSIFTYIHCSLRADDVVAGEAEAKDDAELFDVVMNELRHFNLPQSLKYAKRIREQFASGGYKHGDFKRSVETLRERIEDELDDIVFLFVPNDEVSYYENKTLFGDDVAAKFNQASEDIEEAGNCFAAGRYTACVFHLMRVLEYGLRALSRNLKVRLPRPVELEEWGKLISEI